LQLDKWFRRARRGGIRLWLFNRILDRAIPFNRPHGIRVIAVTETGARTLIPYRRGNLNHIRGIHACGLATVAEFTSGLVLLSRLGTRKYRLIMESLEVKYHYQAKLDAVADFEIEDARLQEEILDPLRTEEAVYISCEVPVVDAMGERLCTARTNWQIKPWAKVRTRV